MSLLHTEYTDHSGRLVLFRCSECGNTYLSIGALHGHAERHRGYTRLGIQIPFTKTAVANVDELMTYTEVVAVETAEPITLDDVEEL